MMRRLLATLTVVALGLALVARADDPAKTKVDPKAKAAAKDENSIDEKVAKAEAAIKQEQLARQFREFEAALLRLAQRMELSSKPEDREKAVILKKAIELASTEGTDTKFDKLVKLLKDKDSLNLQDLDRAQNANKDLAADLAKILAILMTDNRDAELREKIRELNEMLKRLNQVIRDQQTVRAWTDRNAMDKERLEREQRLVRNNTEDLIGQGKPKAGENKEAKGEAKPQGKPSDSKEGGKPGEAKNDTKEAKGDERNQDGKPSDKGGDPKEGKPGDKPGDPKEGKPGEAKEAGKQGDPKEGKPGDMKEAGKAGDPKEGKPSDSKDAGKPSQGGDPKESKPGEAKSGQQGGEPKESKPGEAKSGQQGGEPKQGGKPGEQKDAGKPEGAKENKPGENKDAGKPGDNKDNKPAEAKDAGKQDEKDPKQQAGNKKDDQKQADSKGKQENKADSKGQQSQQSGQPQSGQPQQGEAKSQGKPQQGQPQQGGAKSDPQQQKNQQNQQQQANNDNPAKKQIQDGIEAQQKAETDLKKPDLPKAADNQADAIQKLQEAQRKLEELLKQLRQEEIERILAALQARCERMLAMQIEVRDGTVGVFKNLAEVKPGEEKPRAEVQKSNQLSEKEEEIVQLATKAVDLLKSEGSAVAFPEVFTQIRDDMVTVALRLRKTEVGLVTQAIENDIIETLKEMIEALKKARQDNQQQQQQPQQGQPQQGKPGDQKLIELLNELKMIRSMQLRVNDRTKLYGKEYPGEQAPVPAQAQTPQDREKVEMIQKELKNLAERQDKIFEVTNNIAKGKNK